MELINHNHFCIYCLADIADGMSKAEAIIREAENVELPEKFYPILLKTAEIIAGRIHEG